MPSLSLPQLELFREALFRVPAGKPAHARLQHSLQRHLPHMHGGGLVPWLFLQPIHPHLSYQRAEKRGLTKWLANLIRWGEPPLPPSLRLRASLFRTVVMSLT